MSQNKDKRSEWINKAHENFPKEETAAEFPITHADIRTANRTHDSDQAQARSAGTAIGWTAIIFALASLFIWPILMGAAAVLLGFSAYMQGSRSLGTVSMTIGLIAVIVYLLLIPLYYSIG